MCESGRRCDRPSCPCNEPDTELKDALTRMQERFPKPWMCEVNPKRRDDSEWYAFADCDGCTADGYGPTPYAAVEAAISAWDAAVKADALFATSYRAGLEAAAEKVASEAIEDIPENYAQDTNALHPSDVTYNMHIARLAAAIRALAKEA